MRRSDLVAPVLAGVVTALVGFAGSFPVVLAGQHAAGASAGQAASGLHAVSVGGGIVFVALAPLALPILLLTAVAVAPLLVLAVVPGAVVAALALPVLLVRRLWRRGGPRPPRQARELSPREAPAWTPSSGLHRE